MRDNGHPESAELFKPAGRQGRVVGDNARNRWFPAALATWLVVALAFVPAVAQPRYVQLNGRIQWIAGAKLMLVLDNGLGVVPVDLARVPLDQYRTLTQRDQVTVTGVVSEDNRGIFGESVARIPDWYSWDEQGP